MEKADFYETVENNLNGSVTWSPEDRVRGGFRVLDALTLVVDGEAEIEPELEDDEIRELARRASDTILRARHGSRASTVDTTPAN